MENSKNFQENRLKHWDYNIIRTARCIDNNTCFLMKKSLKVDVKSLKNIQRKDGEKDTILVWLELHGSSIDNKGWIYDGEADIIAFETETSFLLVEKKKIIDLIEEKVDKNVLVNKACDALYCAYNRKNFELITLIELDLLKKIAITEWEKYDFQVYRNPENCDHIEDITMPNDLKDIINKNIKSKRLLNKKLKNLELLGKNSFSVHCVELNLILPTRV